MMPSRYKEMHYDITLDQLYKEFSNTVDSMQGMRVTRNDSDRIYKLSKLTIINNEIRRRGSDAN